MPRIALCLILISLMLLSGCNQASPPSSQVSAVPSPTVGTEQSLTPTNPPTPLPVSGEITVFAATSLAEGFEDLMKAFQLENPEANFTFNFAGSQQLAQQLSQGAMADLFASADRAQIDAASSSGRIDPEQVSAFIGNQLMIITPVDNPGQLSSPSDLAKPGLKLVIADSNVPAGAYTQSFLDKVSAVPEYGADFKQSVMANVVSFEENVRAVMSKVILGEADAGIVYLSDGLQAGPTQVNFIQIPNEINIPVTYYIAPVKDSIKTELAARFLEFILSEQGQSILSRRGFIPVQ